MYPDMMSTNWRRRLAIVSTSPQNQETKRDLYHIGQEMSNTFKVYNIKRSHREWRLLNEENFYDHRYRFVHPSHGVNVYMQDQ